MNRDLFGNTVLDDDAIDAEDRLIDREISRREDAAYASDQDSDIAAGLREDQHERTMWGGAR